jgi:hypothetical protein
MISAAGQLNRHRLAAVTVGELHRGALLRRQSIYRPIASARPRWGTGHGLVGQTVFVPASAAVVLIGRSLQEFMCHKRFQARRDEVSCTPDGADSSDARARAIAWVSRTVPPTSSSPARAPKNRGTGS